MYHGTIVERHGLDTALKAVSFLKGKIKEIFFNVYGDGDFVADFLELREQLGLQDFVKYHGILSLESIAEEIKNIDVGIVPNKKGPFTEINFPTRIFEYLSMGKPVIAPRTRGIKDYFNEEELYFFEPDNVESLAHAIMDVYSDAVKKNEIVKKGMNVYDKYRWTAQKEKLVFWVKKII